MARWTLRLTKPRSISGIGRAADLRFESALESDLLQRFTVLDREPRIDRAGTMTSTEVGGFRVIRPWARLDSPAEVGSHDLHASDL